MTIKFLAKPMVDQERIAKLKSIAIDIMSVSLPIMKRVSDESLINELLRDFSLNITRSDLKLYLQEETSSWTEDCQSIVDEMASPDFQNFVKDGFADHQRLPFFANLWNGDMYDVTELDALDRMYKELLEVQKDANEESLRSKVLDMYGV